MSWSRLLARLHQQINLHQQISLHQQVSLSWLTKAILQQAKTHQACQARWCGADK